MEAGPSSSANNGSSGAPVDAYVAEPSTCGLWGCPLSRLHSGLCAPPVGSMGSRARKKPRVYEGGAAEAPSKLHEQARAKGLMKPRLPMKPKAMAAERAETAATAQTAEMIAVVSDDAMLDGRLDAHLDALLGTGELGLGLLASSEGIKAPPKSKPRQNFKAPSRPKQPKAAKVPPPPQEPRIGARSGTRSRGAPEWSLGEMLDEQTLLAASLAESRTAPGDSTAPGGGTAVGGGGMGVGVGDGSLSGGCTGSGACAPELPPTLDGDWSMDACWSMPEDSESAAASSSLGLGAAAAAQASALSAATTQSAASSSSTLPANASVSATAVSNAVAAASAGESAGESAGSDAAGTREGDAPVKMDAVDALAVEALATAAGLAATTAGGGGSVPVAAGSAASAASAARGTLPLKVSRQLLLLRDFNPKGRADPAANNLMESHETVKLNKLNAEKGRGTWGCACQGLVHGGGVALTCSDCHRWFHAKCERLDYSAKELEKIIATNRHCSRPNPSMAPPLLFSTAAPCVSARFAGTSARTARRCA